MEVDIIEPFAKGLAKRIAEAKVLGLDIVKDRRIVIYNLYALQRD